MITNYTIIGTDSTQNNPGTSLEEQIVTLTTRNPTIFEHTIPLNTSQSGNPPSYDPLIKNRLIQEKTQVDMSMHFQNIVSLVKTERLSPTALFLLHLSIFNQNITLKKMKLKMNF